jgi:hypothetical protein
MRLFVVALIAFAPAAAMGEPAPQALKSGLHAAWTATDFSAQRRRPRVRVVPRQPAAWPYPRPGYYSWPGPNAVRVCNDWYKTEYRPSGTVVTPQMSCRWVRG